MFISINPGLPEVHTLHRKIALFKRMVYFRFLTVYSTPLVYYCHCSYLERHNTELDFSNRLKEFTRGSPYSFITPFHCRPVLIRKVP